MICSYMDESFDMKQSGVFAVGGLLGRGVAIFELERRWEKLLRRPDIDIEYFKASECQLGVKQFRKFVKDPAAIAPLERNRLDSISLEFHDAIVNMPFEPSSYVITQGVGVIQDDFYEVIKDDYARSILGRSPYWLAYNFAMIQCAWAMKELEELGRNDFVAFTCDECEEHSQDAYDSYSKLKATNPKAAEYMGGFGSEDEKRCIPLQAADAVIYEIRRVLHLALGQRKGELSKQFRVLAKRKVVFIVQHCNKEHLLNIVRTHKPGEPFRLDEIMDQKFNENIIFGAS